MMERSKVMRSNTKQSWSDSVWSIVSKRFFDLADFTSVIASICAILCLIYLTFVKDFVEVVIYSIIKYINRLEWLYRIFQNVPSRINDIKQGVVQSAPQAIDSLPKTTPASSLDTDVPIAGSTPLTPSGTKNKLLINPRIIDFTGETSSAGGHIQRMNISPEENTASNPGKIVPYSEKNTAAISQNITLNSNCETDSVFISPNQKSNSRRKSFGWNFRSIRNSFRKDNEIPMLHRVNAKCKNLAAKVVPNVVEDEEKMIVSSDSPIAAGCCDTLFHCFRSKFQLDENLSHSMHYKRF